MVICVLLLSAQIGFFNKCSVFGFNIFDLPVKQTKWIILNQTYEVFSKLQYVTIKKYIKGMHLYM